MLPKRKENSNIRYYATVFFFFVEVFVFFVILLSTLETLTSFSIMSMASSRVNPATRYSLNIFHFAFAFVWKYSAFAT